MAQQEKGFRVFRVAFPSAHEKYEVMPPEVSIEPGVHTCHGAEVMIRLQGEPDGIIFVAIRERRAYVVAENGIGLVGVCAQTEEQVRRAAEIALEKCDEVLAHHVAIAQAS